MSKSKKQKNTIYFAAALINIYWIKNIIQSFKKQIYVYYCTISCMIVYITDIQTVRRLGTIVFYVPYLKKKWVLFIMFIVTISSILTQLKVKGKWVKSLNINKSFSVLSPKPSIYQYQNVLWPLPDDIAPRSHATMEIEHSVYETLFFSFWGVRTLYQCFFLNLFNWF